MNALLPGCGLALLTATISMAAQPQNEPLAGSAQPALVSSSAHLLPDQTQTPRMKAWCALHYGLFIHFNMNTYGKGQNCGAIPASSYKPVKLDVDSWIRLAKEAGMRYAVLTVKHTPGFCLWDSKVRFQGKEFDYDVAATDYKTDVVQAFLDACRKYGLAPGFYYCLADVYADKRSLPEILQGKGGSLTDETFKHFKAQLSELAANYPACEYYWLDIPSAASVAQQGELYDLLRRANPNNVVLMNQHLAAGADDGQNLLEKKHNTAYPVDVLNTESKHAEGYRTSKGKISNVQNWNGKKLFMGYEHCSIAGSGWFKTQDPKSVEVLFALYKNVREAGGNLLLDIGPTPDGTMPVGFDATLMALKAQIEPFEASLAKDNH